MHEDSPRGRAIDEAHSLGRMTPPLHVKAVSALLNSVVVIAGVRNILAPGVPVALIPEDDVFQLHAAGIELLLRTLGTKARLQEGLRRLQPGSSSGKVCEDVCPGA